MSCRLFAFFNKKGDRLIERRQRISKRFFQVETEISIAQVIGYMKGKSAIHIARTYLGQRKNYNGMSFWARGYFVTTVGADEETVRIYIRDQEKEDLRVEQLSLFK